MDDGLLTWRDIYVKGSLATANGAYVYAICDSVGEVIYVGSTTRLRKRLGKHFAWPRKNRCVPGRWRAWEISPLSYYLQEHAAEVLNWQVFFVRCGCDVSDDYDVDTRLWIGESRARQIESDLIYRWSPYFNDIGTYNSGLSIVPTPAPANHVINPIDFLEPPFRG